jgi:hypothetical protein
MALDALVATMVETDAEVMLVSLRSDCGRLCTLIERALIEVENSNGAGDEDSIPFGAPLAAKGPAPAITDYQIYQLEAEAKAAGDDDLLDVCRRALALDEDARLECGRRIAAPSVVE